MKKNLLISNVVLYAILYSISLVYMGYEYGEGSLFPYPRGPEYLLLPAVYLILLLRGIFLALDRGYGTSKSYSMMAIVTLAYPSLLWGSWLFFYYQGRMTSASVVDIVLYPAVLLAVSVAISILYFICAIRTRK